MDTTARILLQSAIAYGLGSIPFAIILTRWKIGKDVRSFGSGHAGATNVIRVAGWVVGIAVSVLDILKGYLAVWLAPRIGGTNLAVVLSAVFVVAGHCWPIFAGFRGGMGVGSGIGVLAAVWPFGLVLGVGLGASLQLVIRHSARANVVTGLLIAPLWALFGASNLQIATVAATGLLVAFRATSDWNRVYRELWLDRESLDSS